MIDETHETGFPFVGELRGESPGDEDDLLEKEDEDEEDDEDRDALFLPALVLHSLIESLRRALRSFRPMGAARDSSSSVRATARSGAGSMDWIRGGGCSGGDDSPLPTFTLTAGPPFLTLLSTATVTRAPIFGEAAGVQAIDPRCC